MLPLKIPLAQGELLENANLAFSSNLGILCHEVDAKRLLCPLPIIRLQQAITQLVTGELVRIYCTDPGVLQDIPAWCRMHGHIVKEIAQEPEHIIVHVEVGKK